MSTPTTTFTRLPQDVQSQILNAATASFSHKKYEDLSIREITKAMNVTTGSFYRYFNSKEELYIYLVDREIVYFWNRIKKNDDLRKPLSDNDIFMLSDDRRGFWQMFYESSLEIRRKFYFRTADSVLFTRTLSNIPSLKNAGKYSETELEVTAFLLVVLRYIITAYRSASGKEFGEDKMLQMLQDMVVTGFESRGKNNENK